MHQPVESKMKNNNMASPLFGLFCTSFIILVAVKAPVGAAEEIKVGDDEGWRVPGANNSAMYSHWAARNRFVVGDSLCEFCECVIFLFFIYKTLVVFLKQNKNVIMLTDLFMWHALQV